MEKRQERFTPGKTVGTLQQAAAGATPTNTAPEMSSPGTSTQTTPKGSLRLSPRPTRGILKLNSNQAVNSPPPIPETKQSSGATNTNRRKSQRWDEKNILATYHPPGKDYGLIKVDEPKTPFNRILDDGTEEDRPTGGTFLNPVALTPELLAERLAALDGISPKALQAVEGRSRSRLQDAGSKRGFLNKRKSHYNEGRFLSQSPRASSQDESDEESAAGVHLRLAQQLLEQERKAKDNPEDKEFLAPVLSKRSSTARRVRLASPQGKQTFQSKDSASEKKGGTEPQPQPPSQSHSQWQQQPGVSSVKDPKQQKKSK